MNKKFNNSVVNTEHKSYADKNYDYDDNVRTLPNLVSGEQVGESLGKLQRWIQLRKEVIIGELTEGTGTIPKKYLPSEAFTDESVNQTSVSDDKNYRVLLSNTNTDSDENGAVKKSTTLLYNPNTKKLTNNGGEINAYKFTGDGSELTGLTGAVEGSYGVSADSTPGYGGNFNVPFIQIDNNGRITNVTNKKITLPASDNTDAKVKRTNDTSSNKDYKLLLTNETTTENVTDFALKSDVTYNPSTKKLKVNNDPLVPNSSLVDIVNAGAKNIYDPLQAKSAFEDSNTNTITMTSGTKSVTFTLNSDNTITVSGATEGTTPTLILDTGDLSKYSGLKLSGAASANAFLQIEMAGTPHDLYAKDTGTGAAITTIPTGNHNFFLRLASNTSFATPITIKPMICTKSQHDISPDYVPYAESNAVLTQKVKELEHTDNIFGYHINPNESDPYEAVTYVANARGMVPAKMTGGGFSYGSWGSAFFLPRPCVLNFDGTVAYYLDPNDYSKKIDGTAATIDSSNTTGNVMLEFPKIWIKRVPGTADGERTVYIADRKVDSDYKCFSNINSQNTEIDKFYIHAYNGTIHSSQMRSLSGVALNSTYALDYTARQEILAAKANNPSGSNVMWFTDVWSDMMLLFDLLYLMGKSLDVQRTFGQGLSGGSETAMRAYVTGSLNNKGLFWGDTIGTNMAVKVLGIENLWGCRWNRIAGMINVAGNLKVKMTYGTADGSTATEYETPTESTDATQNLTAAGYLDYGTILKSNGYISKIQADNSKGYKITSVTGGTDSKYYCDYYYQASAANTKYYALFGGSSGDGARCGFFVALYYGAANTSWNVGGALSCKP